MTETEILTAIPVSGTTLAAMLFVSVVAFLVPVAAFILFKKKNPQNV